MVAADLTLNRLAVGQHGLVTRAQAGALPEPVRQHPVRFPDGKVVRIDLAYPDELVAIEADGRRWHAGLADSRRDHRRDVSLVTLGWAVLRYGWSDLGRGRELADEVRACRHRSAVPRRLSYR